MEDVVARGGSNDTAPTPELITGQGSDPCLTLGGCTTDYIAAVMSAFVCGFILAAAGLLYLKREHTPFKAKQVPLMIWQSVGSVLWIISLVLSRNLFSFRSLPWSACSMWIVWIGGLFGYGLWISCHSARVYRLYFVFVGRRLPPLNSLQIVSVLLMPWLMMAIVAESTDAFENRDGLCHWGKLADAVMSIMMGVYVAMFIFGTWLVRNIQFAFNEYHDLKKATVITVIFFGFWFMFYILKRVIQQKETSRKLQVVDRFSLVLAADIAALLFLWMPIIKPMRMLMDRESEDIDFLQQVEHNQPDYRAIKSGLLVPVGLSLSDLDGPLERLLEKRMFLESFKKFAESRFAGEAVHFYETVRERKKLALSSTIEKVYIATYIIDKFIQAGSPEEINISSRMRHQILSTTDLGGDHLFDDAVKEAIGMMSMNLEKDYRESAGFMELKKKVVKTEEAREQLKRMNIRPPSIKKNRRSQDRGSMGEGSNVLEKNPWALMMAAEPPSPLNRDIWKRDDTGVHLPGFQSTALGPRSTVVGTNLDKDAIPRLASCFASPSAFHQPRVALHQQQVHDYASCPEISSPHVRPVQVPSQKSQAMNRGTWKMTNSSPTTHPDFSKGSIGTGAPAEMTPDIRIQIPLPRQSQKAGGGRGRGGAKLTRTKSTGSLNGRATKPPTSNAGRPRTLNIDIFEIPPSKARGSRCHNWMDTESDNGKDGRMSRRRKRGHSVSIAGDGDLYPFVTYGQYLDGISQAPSGEKDDTGKRQHVFRQSLADAVQGGEEDSSGISGSPLTRGTALGNALRRSSRSLSLGTHCLQGYRKHHQSHHRASCKGPDLELGESDLYENVEKPFLMLGSHAADFRRGTLASSRDDSNSRLDEKLDVLGTSNSDPYDSLLRSSMKSSTDLTSSRGNGSESFTMQGWRGDARGDPGCGIPLCKGLVFTFPSFSSCDSSPTSRAFKRLPFPDSSGEEYDHSSGGGGYKDSALQNTKGHRIY